jgi:hypothetical protein
MPKPMPSCPMSNAQKHHWVSLSIPVPDTLIRIPVRAKSIEIFPRLLSNLQSSSTPGAKKAEGTMAKFDMTMADEDAESNEYDALLCLAEVLTKDLREVRGRCSVCSWMRHG